MIAKTASFSEIDSRGFLLIRSFLDEQQIELLRRDYEAASLEVNANYSVRRISAEAMGSLQDKLEEVVKGVEEHSTVRADLLNDGVYFATFSEKATLTSPRKGPQAFPWHQDHENYWLWQDCKNYLNFYIPVVKPVAEKSNLTVAPFDRFQQLAPDVYQRSIGRGATRVLKSGGSWIVKDDDQGGKVGRLDFDLADIEETPHLQPGDLLLLRGDVFHRTQDSSTRRIAASIRYLNSETKIHRSRIAKGSLAKLVMMLNARYLFEPAFRCFDAADTDVLPAGEIDRYMKELTQRRLKGEEAANTGRLAFLARLAREKLRRAKA